MRCLCACVYLYEVRSTPEYKAFFGVWKNVLVKKKLMTAAYDNGKFNFFCRSGRSVTLLPRKPEPERAQTKRKVLTGSALTGWLTLTCKEMYHLRLAHSSTLVHLASERSRTGEYCYRYLGQFGVLFFQPFVALCAPRSLSSLSLSLTPSTNTSCFVPIIFTNAHRRGLNSLLTTGKLLSQAHQYGNLQATKQRIGFALGRRRQ